MAKGKTKKWDGEECKTMEEEIKKQKLKRQGEDVLERALQYSHIETLFGQIGPLSV